jgi:[heparan sulfate]-glucosamine 3-sulfotransferase 3
MNIHYCCFRNQMPNIVHSQTVSIEKTPHYFIDRQTPARLAYLLPHVKLIIILRDPIQRAISDYVQLKYRHESYPTFDQFIDSTNYTRWTPVRIGCYTTYLRRWLKHIGLERMHFVDGENLIHRPWEELEAVQNFLNITNYIRQEHFYFNSNKRGFPCVRQPDGCLGSSKGRPHPDIADSTREKLHLLYSKCNRHLKQLAQIKFPWL